jgi:hypothetical protein
MSCHNSLPWRRGAVVSIASGEENGRFESPSKNQVMAI